MFDRNYQLHEVSPGDLMKYRLSGKAGLVIKINDKLLLAKLPRKSTLPTRALASGLCKTCGNVCKDCPKSSAMTLSLQLGFGFSFQDSVEKYGRPEKYHFVTSAVEIFNAKSSDCVVLKCSNYSERNPDDYEPQYFAETI